MQATLLEAVTFSTVLRSGLAGAEAAAAAERVLHTLHLGDQAGTPVGAARTCASRRRLPLCAAP